MWDWKVNKSCGSLKCAAENEFKEKWILGNGCHNHSVHFWSDHSQMIAKLIIKAVDNLSALASLVVICNDPTLAAVWVRF